MSKRTTGAAQAAPAPRKSGKNIPESQRHDVKLQLRVPPAIVAQLDALCRQHDDPAYWMTRSNFLSALIDSETNRAKRRKRAPGND